MQTRAPSVKSLMTISRDIDRAKAVEIRAIIVSTTSEQLQSYVASGRYPKTAKWVSQCFNAPNPDELRTALLNESIDGFGIESVADKSSPSWCGTPLFEYINVGHTYAPTLCLYRGKWIVSDWGTLAEKHSREIA